jgi:hypothetical protein
MRVRHVHHVTARTGVKQTELEVMARRREEHAGGVEH